MACAQTMLEWCSSSAVLVNLACVACMIQGCLPRGSQTLQPAPLYTQTRHPRVNCTHTKYHEKIIMQFTCDDTGRRSARCAGFHWCTPACRDAERWCSGHFAKLQQVAKQRAGDSTNVTQKQEAAKTEPVDFSMQEAGTNKQKLPKLRWARIHSQGAASSQPHQLKLRAGHS
mmetsp:Transcript_122881/g.244412  ORF Transcript_122881/g.244412 Transcript_122881/m.244412 type:complete len:172 (+) Transcript_122881:79-594(+)